MNSGDVCPPLCATNRDYRTHFLCSGKNELIQTRRWADVVEVEIATFEWVNWWNKSRLHQSLDYRTPAEVESEFWSKSSAQDLSLIHI